MIVVLLHTYKSCLLNAYKSCLLSSLSVVFSVTHRFLRNLPVPPRPNNESETLADQSTYVHRV